MVQKQSLFERLQEGVKRHAIGLTPGLLAYSAMPLEVRDKLIGMALTYGSTIIAGAAYDKDAISARDAGLLALGMTAANVGAMTVATNLDLKQAAIASAAGLGGAIVSRNAHRFNQKVRTLTAALGIGLATGASDPDFSMVRAASASGLEGAVVAAQYVGNEVTELIDAPEVRKPAEAELVERPVPRRPVPANPAGPTYLDANIRALLPDSVPWISARTMPSIDDRIKAAYPLFSALERIHNIPEGYLGAFALVETSLDVCRLNKNNEGSASPFHIMPLTSIEIGVPVSGPYQKRNGVDLVHGHYLRKLVDDTNCDPRIADIEPRFDLMQSSMAYAKHVKALYHQYSKYADSPEEAWDLVKSRINGGLRLREVNGDTVAEITNPGYVSLFNDKHEEYMETTRRLELR